MDDTTAPRSIPDPAAVQLLGALQRQRAQLAIVHARLADVEPPGEGDGALDWRGPARTLFDLGMLDLRRTMAVARVAVDDALAETTQAAATVASRVG